MIAGLALHLRHAGRTVVEFRLAQAQMHAARLLKGEVKAGARGEVGGECGPLARRTARPALVPGRAKTLGLHPDQAEIAARRAVGDVALIQQDGVEALVAQTQRDGRADKAAADGDGVEGTRVHADMGGRGQHGVNRAQGRSRP